jgi:hypothetical protein
VLSDSSNASALGGVSDYADIADWTAFDAWPRGWGRAGGAGFPDITQRGQCGAGSCRVWDWRLSSADTLFLQRSGDGRNVNEPFVPGGSCPDAVHGDRALTDMQTIANTFLVNALEVLGDALGDENGLCESGEACVYSPSFGAWQGEGDYLTQSGCLFQDGVVSGVTMYGYPADSVP